MANHHKLLLEDDEITERFFLFAIHCSEEPFKIAFILNKQAQLCLKRANSDLQVSINKNEVLFPVFNFEDTFLYTKYNLVANKSNLINPQTEETSNLFSTVKTEKHLVHYLIPKQQKVDYFLKVSAENENKIPENLLSKINNIQQIISAYTIDTAYFKPINHLISD